LTTENKIGYAVQYILTQASFLIRSSSTTVNSRDVTEISSLIKSIYRINC